MSDQEYNQRLNALMPELIKRGKATSGEQIKEMFFLYNERLTPKETKKSCAGCRTRVFKRMTEYYETLNK